MYDEAQMKSMLKSVETLANRYKNEYHDYDELFSEGQYCMITYITKHGGKNATISNNNLYSCIKRAIEKLANTTDAMIDYDTDMSILSVASEMNFSADLFDKWLRNVLTEKQYYVISNHFGFNTNAKTLLEISKDLQISVGRCNDLEKVAIQRLKKHTVAYKSMADFIDKKC